MREIEEQLSNGSNWSPGTERVPYVPAEADHQTPVEAIRFPRGERQRLLLFNLAEADPQDPDNPEAFKHSGIRSVEYLSRSFPDKTSRGELDVKVCAHNAKVQLNAYFRTLEDPNERGVDARERVLSIWRQMRMLNPRLATVSDTDLIQKFKSMISASTTKAGATEEPVLRARKPREVVLINNPHKKKEPRGRGHGGPKRDRTTPKTITGVEMQRRIRKRQKRAGALDTQLFPAVYTNIKSPQVPEPEAPIRQEAIDNGFSFLDHLAEVASTPQHDLPFGSIKGADTVERIAREVEQE
jgi:hypothetical protein